MLLPYAKQLLAQADYAEAQLMKFKQSRTMLITLGAFASACSSLLPPTIMEFRRKHNDAMIIMRQLETRPAISALQEGAIDLAVTLDYNNIRTMDASGLRRIFLLNEPLDVAVPADNELSRLATLAPGKLNNMPWIEAPQAGLSMREISLALPSPPANELRYDGDSFDNVLALVASGVGLALVPRLTVQDMPAGVVRRPLAGSPVTRNICAYVRHDADSSAATISMLDLLREHCRQISSSWGGHDMSADEPGGTGTEDTVTAAAAADMRSASSPSDGATQI